MLRVRTRHRVELSPVAAQSRAAVAQFKEEAMGAAENVATMQRAYDAFNVADLDTLTEIFDENIVWHLPGNSSMATDYQGRDAVLTYFGQLGQRTDGTFRAELERLMADDDGRVVGFQRSTGDRNGSHLDVGNCIVFTLEDGRVTDGREHFEDLYAWDQFGSWLRGVDEVEARRDSRVDRRRRRQAAEGAAIGDG